MSPRGQEPSGCDHFVLSRRILSAIRGTRMAGDRLVCTGKPSMEGVIEISDEARAAMTHVTRDDVIKAFGAIDDVTVAQIIATDATVDELAEALAWLANDEPLLNSG